MRMMKIIFAFAVILSLFGLASAQSASFVSYQQQADFQTYYSPGDIANYWPILKDSEECKANQDLVLQVAPGGCQPMVVRSDLLAEQNVPVFCQIDAMQVNPLADVKQIRNIRFGGQYPKEVAGVGFHPAKAAIRTRDSLLGSPNIDNVGYVVVILKKNPNEKTIPDSVKLNLAAQLDYESGNAIGIGKSEFVLQPVSPDERDLEKIRNSFWKGRYSVILEEVDANYATVSLYDGDRKITTQRLKKGSVSNEIYLPGTYCSVALQMEYASFDAAKNSARVEVTNELGTEAFDVYEGSTFLNGKCRVSKVGADPADISKGNLTIVCGKSYLLSLNPVFKQGMEVVLVSDNQIYIINNVSDKGITLKRDDIIKTENGKVKLFKPEDLKPKEISDKDIGSQKENFDSVIQAYEEVVVQFPAEQQNSEGLTTPATFSTYGEDALNKAILFAETNEQYATKARLLNELIEKYPNSPNLNYYKTQLANVYQRDLASTSLIVEANGRTNVISLISTKAPAKKPSADFTIDTTELHLEELGEFEYPSAQKSAKIKLTKLYADSANVEVLCWDGKRGQYVKEKDYSLAEGAEAIKICEATGSKYLMLKNVDIEQAARIRISPRTKVSGAQINLSVNIGIEKRAIQLSPDKTRERIKNLNESIKKWEQISTKLGKVVTGLKTACFATSTVLTVKNFFSGLGGEAIARQQTMSGSDGWIKKCEGMIAGTIPSKKPYRTITECLNDNNPNITAEIQARKTTIQEVNARVKAAEKDYRTEGSLFSDAVVQTAPAKDKYIADNRELFLSSGLDIIKLNATSYKDLRDLDYQLTMQKKGYGSQSTIDEIKARAENSYKLQQEREASKNAGLLTSSTPTPKASKTEGQMSTRFIPISDGKISNVALPDLPTDANIAVDISGSDGKRYFVVGKLADDGRTLSPRGYYEYSSGIAKFEGEDVSNIYDKEGITQIIKQAESIEGTLIVAEDQIVTYFGSGPDKGLAETIPFDVDRGWYVKIVSSLGVGGNVASYDSSGLPKVWHICNVGSNGRIDGIGIDDCEQYREGLNVAILGLSSTRSSQLISQSRNAIRDANRQSGSKIATISGKSMSTSLATPYSGTQCQEFMSITDCKILFNVCDPVICPATRCDLGGKYRVADVIQSGIVGSALLCLPNYREGIVMPVCLTGIQAGIDGYVSILKNHRDCLQESLDNGRMVGVCDQIYSIYMCEFFWRQVGPMMDILIPKLIEIAYTGGVSARGGAEYLTVQQSWDNARASANYMTQNYAANSIKAFQARSSEEAGSQICKAFISSKGATAFNTLVEPDSPPQFHAWFSAIKHSDATVPATSQYKVFYHIFAGNDAGVSYSVYLKNPPASPYYSQSATIQVASGYIAKGQYASQTKDFTAPEGYQELCVRINGKDECGFKQVSTSFALNYLRDQYAKDQITQTNIRTEKECVSGTASLGAVLANTNPQSALEESAMPNIQSRGIIRVCSSINPGASTDPTRYKNVGTCGTEKMICWLDTKSIDRAITDANIGLKNATAEELKYNLAAQDSAILGDVEGAAKIKDLRERVLALKVGEDTKADQIIKEADALFYNIVMNNQQAALLWIKAIALEKKFAKAVLAAVTQATTQKAQEALPAPELEEEAAGAETAETISNPKLSIKEAYRIQTKQDIYLNDVKSNFFVINSFFYYLDPSSNKYAPLGTLNSERKLYIRQDSTDSKMYLLTSEEDASFSGLSWNRELIYDAFNGKIIQYWAEETSETETAGTTTPAAGETSGVAESKVTLYRLGFTGRVEESVDNGRTWSLSSKGVGLLGAEGYTYDGATRMFIKQ